jgi:hypothetical protein
MSVDFDKFLKWATNRFGEENVVVKGKEIRLNSIFEPDDDDFHMWCSPSGGKKKRKGGVFHCFKTDKKGSLVKLVQIVDHCDRQDALDILAGHTSIRDLEKNLEDILGTAEDPVVVEPPKSDVTLPVGSLLISDLGTNNWWRKKAEEYLTKRCLPIDGLYICTEDKYKARIIIPYYDRDGKLIYWNGRHIGNSKCKYLGPDKEQFGVGKEDVVFMAGKWPAPGSTVYVCEGELNAVSLKVAEFNAAACGGKNMGEKQALALDPYRLVLALDRDKAGKAGTTKMTSMINMVHAAQGLRGGILVVAPPAGCNDWNDVLVKFGAAMLHHYVVRNQRPLDNAWPFGHNAACIKTLLE